MIRKSKLYLIMYFLIILLCLLIHIPIFQNILLLIASFILNLSIIYKLNIRSRKYKFVSFFIIVLNIVLIYAKYYNTIAIGFLDGLPYGQIGNNNYSDSYGYYYQSIALSDLWLNGGVKDWILGNISKNYISRGIYNYFIVFNSIIRVLFGKDLIVWMIIKYQFSIMSIALLYKISSNFVKEKYSLMCLIIFNFYPGYVLVNGDLLRDNFIVFFALLTVYITINSINNGKIKWIKIILLLSVITYLRVYIGIILGFSLFIYLFFDKLNVKKLISYSVIALLMVLIVGKIMEFWGYGFLGLKLLQSGDIGQIQWNTESVNSPVKLCIRTLYFAFTGGRTSISHIYYIQEWYNSYAPVFIAVFSFPTILSIFFIKIFDKKRKKFIIFTFVYSLFSAFMVTYGFSSIIPRLYICWFWSQCIVLAMLMNSMSKLKGTQRQLLNIEYMCYIVFILIGFIRWNL